MTKACVRPVEAPAEAVEDVDGMPERGVVSSRSPTKEIRLRWVPMAREKMGQGEGCIAMVLRGSAGGCVLGSAVDGAPATGRGEGQGR